MPRYIFSDVRFRTLHSGCAASLAAAVALAVAFIAVDAVYFVLLPPTHACALGPSALHRLQRQFTHPVQSHTHHVSHYVQAYYVRDITASGQRRCKARTRCSTAAWSGGVNTSGAAAKPTSLAMALSSARASRRRFCLALAAPSWRCRSALAFVLDLAFALPLGAMATSLKPQSCGML